MSQQYDDNVNPDDVIPDGNEPEGIKALRESRDRQEARAREEAANAAATAKENAWLKAGIDTDLPLAKTLLASYDGELTREAVRTWVEAQGAAPVLLPAKTEPTTEPTRVEGEERSTEERSALADGGEPPGEPKGADPVERMHESFKRDQERGVSADVAGAAALEQFLEDVANDPDSPLRLGGERSRA